jgi:hypothetical protein
MGGRVMDEMARYIIRRQYIENWHDDFVERIGRILCFYDTLMALPQATEEDKQVLGMYKAFFQGKDVMDIESDLMEGTVNKNTLDKIEKLGKDLVDLALKHIPMGALEKLFLKQLYCIYVEQSRAEKEREMTMMGIQVA